MITILSWNLCLLNTSAQAPLGWRIDQTEAKVREQVLDLAPDFVFFQELPGLVPYVETHDLIPVNTITHSGNLATLCKRELMDETVNKAVGRFAILTSLMDQNISIANVHLEPSKGGADKRMAMLTAIHHACPTKHLVIVGDTNTRIAEEARIEQQGFVGKRPPKPTWDTRKNQFREGGHAYACYYTRYFHTAGAEVNEVEVLDEPVVLDSQTFYLSDHFPLSCQVQVAKLDLDQVANNPTDTTQSE